MKQADYAGPPPEFYEAKAQELLRLAADAPQPDLAISLLRLATMCRRLAKRTRKRRKVGSL